MTKDESDTQLTYSIFSQLYHRLRHARDHFYSWRYLSWLILLVSATNVIFIGGKRRAFGIFVAALHTSYNQTSMSELNWIGDSYASLGFFLMPFATTIIVKLNRPYRFTMFLAGVTIFTSCMTSATVPDPGYLFLTHTILHGIGSTLVLCGCSLVTGDYFDKTHRFHVLATAFVSGGPYGVLLFGPLFSYWIHDYSWQKAFVFSGILFLCVTWVAAVTFLPRDMYEYNRAENNLEEPPEDEIKQDESKPKKKASANIYLQDQPKASDGRGWAFCSVAHLRQNPQIFMWALERLFHNIVIYGLLMNLTAYVTQSLNNELILGAKVNLYFGIGESIIFTIGALIGDRIRGKLPLVYLVGAAFSALFLIIVQRSYTDINVVYVLSGLTGGAVGVGNTFLYATAEEVMLVHGSIAFPMTKMVAGVGMIIAPAFSGAVIDAYGYRGFFISMAVLVSLRVVLLALVCIILHHKHKQMLNEVVEKRLLGDRNDVVHCCEYTMQDCEIKRMESQLQQQEHQKTPRVTITGPTENRTWPRDSEQIVP